MRTNINDIIKKMPAAHQMRVKERAAELMVEEMPRQHSLSGVAEIESDPKPARRRRVRR
jgi:hypothetical protein